MGLAYKLIIVHYHVELMKCQTLPWAICLSSSSVPGNVPLGYTGTDEAFTGLILAVESVV